MSVVANVVEYAQSIARAGVAAALAFSVGTTVDAANRVGCYADVTAAAEKLTFVVGGVTGPSLDRTGAQVIVSGLVVSDSSFTVADNSDPTKTLTFQCGSLTTGFGLVIDVGAQAANRTLSVPVLADNRTLAVIDQAQTFTAAQTIASGSISASSPGLTLTQTWDNAAVSFTASSINITDTASNATCYLAQWSIGGVARFQVEKTGSIRAVGPAGDNCTFSCDAGAGGSSIFQWKNNGSLSFQMDTGGAFFNLRDQVNSYITAEYTYGAVGAGYWTFYNTKDATSSTAASVALAGGLAVAKGQYVGTFLNVGTTARVNSAAIGVLGVATATETAPDSVAGWSATQHTILAGPASATTSAALAVSLNRTNGAASLIALAPGVAWQSMLFHANNYEWRTGGATTAKMTLSPTGALTLASGNLIITAPTTPASAAATGIIGTIAWDTGYLYVCTATDTWKRVAIATW